MQRIYWMFLATIVIAACHRDPGAGAPSAVVAKKKPSSQSTAQLSASEQTANMVEAPSQGKSQAPINLKFELAARPVIGEPLTLELALLPQAPAAAVEVQIKGSEGIDLPAEERAFDLPAVDAQQVYRHPVHLTPTAEGLQLLTLTVSLKHDELTENRAFAVPLIVGGAAEGSAAGGTPAPAVPAPAAPASAAPAHVPGPSAPAAAKGTG